MARATKEQSQATAARVLATARRLFTEHGYAAVGLEEVAAQSGVTRGAVYHHFASKRGLFEAVLAQVQRSVADAVDRHADSVADPWDKLEIGCRTFLGASVQDDARRIMLIDAPAVLGWNAWRGQDAANSGRLLEDVLRELADAGLLETTSVEATSALLSGAMNEAALWIASASSSEPRAATDQAWAVLHQMLNALRPGRTGSASSPQHGLSPAPSEPGVQ